MSDLVHQLRQAADDQPIFGIGGLLRHAADEIERLTQREADLVHDLGLIGGDLTGKLQEFADRLGGEGQ